jgi:energy-coupling factor transporter ATP-binding protein EcfA2
MVKLRWLQVNKFRSVKPGTRLIFNDGYNVLLGQNGTGKTTLLNLVAAAVKSDFTDFKDEEFELEYELATGKTTAAIFVRHQRRPQPLLSALEGIPHNALQEGGLAAEGALRASVLVVKARISGEKSGLGILLEIEGRRGVARHVDAGSSGPAIELDLSDVEKAPLWALVATGLMQWAGGATLPQGAMSEFSELFFEFNSSRFDESLEYFNRLSELNVNLVRNSAGGIIPLGNLPWPMLVVLMAHAEKRWGDDRYAITDAEIQFLGRAVELLDFESAEAVIDLKSLSSRDGMDTMLLGGLKFYFRHRGGWKISEKQLSYGQKRMLAFLHYLAWVKSTVIADELVNGLHHRWIRACIEMMGQRQVFLTSQNPLLLDYLAFQSPEEVRSTFVLCSWEKGPEQMVWKNMSEEAAEDFFDSYKVRFQQVGELLQAKGLW